MAPTTREASGYLIGSGEAAREDYALRQAPPTWRYPASTLVITLLGGATAAFFLALPAQLAAQFGVANTLIGIVYAVVLQTVLNYVFVGAANRTGLSSDLMSRGLGLGFDGSAWTTFVYFIGWVFYFGFEGQILATALTASLGFPTWLSNILVGLVFLPLVVFGLKFMFRFQLVTLFVYIGGAIALVAVALASVDPGQLVARAGTASDTAEVGGLGLLAVIAAYNGLIGSVTFGHADLARLLSTTRSLAPSKRGDVLRVSLIPYSIVAYAVFGLLGILLWLATDDTNPGVYFVTLLGPLGLALLFLTQVRINLINAYSGSLSLANFFSRFQYVPGRSVWAVVIVVLGTALMFVNIVENLAPALTFLGVLLSSWTGVILADLVIVRGRGHFGPDGGRFIEYRRAMLTRWNKVGVSALVVSTVVGVILALGGLVGLFSEAASPIANALSNIVAFGLAVVITAVLGFRDRGRSYSRRELIRWPREDLVIECPLDGEVVDTEDLFPCPYHEAWICSHSCMATRGCGEICAEQSEEELLRISLPPPTPSLRLVNRELAGREHPDGKRR